MALKPNVQVTPLNSFIDEEVSIIITGCQPNEQVTLLATLKDENNNTFTSNAMFETDDQGHVDLSTTAPLKGTYSEVDSSGLFWSMQHESKRHGDYFTKSKADDLHIQLSLQINQTIVTTTTVTRFFKQNVSREEIRENGTVGVLYRPVREGSYPNVVLLAGSDGDRLEHSAALLASKGYNVFDLSYFNQEGVPKDLENIPLEYFYNSIQLLKQRTNSSEKVTLIGYSRGAELALLLASIYDEFNAVIAGAPSSYMTSGLRNTVYAPIPAWSFNGEALPYLKFRYSLKMMGSMFLNWVMKKPFSFLGIWNRSLSLTNDPEEFRIKVESIKAQVLLISGDRDQCWPSSEFAMPIKEKLPNTEHLQYKEAGHFLAYPYSLPNMPANINIHVGGGMIMDFGGSKEANAKAAKDTWLKILSFIEDVSSQSN
ncbi:acyl-CoA thioesterase/bile acid-CoA:amino acid N-acyltransferase family protein [Bacillus horti]|uniref:Pimeloyl-ACP methyl ester carboxylesterase n=1 Tax=Caldalkalibacillus horti TaxID=77523 RepID=A0ABT9VZA4_9BACI|nr:acyl-CoA thioesterase/BAAT N-terminal domain-containing protein [Bacillus horti]MDQ0166204.1 pimeloyl-ACP methyl ester carboxylesterase [Bacillus horti]